MVKYWGQAYCFDKMTSYFPIVLEPKTIVLQNIGGDCLPGICNRYIHIQFLFLFDLYVSCKISLCNLGRLKGFKNNAERNKFFAREWELADDEMKKTMEEEAEKFNRYELNEMNEEEMAFLVKQHKKKLLHQVYKFHSCVFMFKHSLYASYNNFLFLHIQEPEFSRHTMVPCLKLT